MTESVCRRPDCDVEREVAHRLSALTRTDFGLTPDLVSATISERTLWVRMQDALTPMARVIAQSPQGPQVLESVYTLLLDSGRLRMHQLIACIVGRPVRRSEITVDLTQGDVSFLFVLTAGSDRF